MPNNLNGAERLEKGKYYPSSMEIIRCNCKAGCSTRRCTCKKQGLHVHMHVENVKFEIGFSSK